MSIPKLRAKELLREYENISLPVDPKKIAEAKGIIVKEDDVEGYTGMLLVVNSSALISIKRGIREPGKKRFTLAHELGHYFLPNHITHLNTNFRCTETDLNNFGQKGNKESEANEFAAELLMPEEAFIERIKYNDLSYDLIQSLTKDFDTSLTATSIRFVELNSSYAVVCSQDSKIKWFFKGEGFPYYVCSSGAVSESSVAIDFYRGKKLPKSFESVPADAWLDDHKVKENMEILEMAIPLPYYNQVLSFLRIDSCDEDQD